MSIRPNDPPLIVTALLDETSSARLNALRTSFFPPALNRVPAHISLFHHLPGAERAAVLRDAVACCAAYRPFDLCPSGSRFLGRGVAIDYVGAEILELRRDLAEAWARWLIPQDRQPFRPHATIQNKVTPAAAKALVAGLDPVTFPICRIGGIVVWRYLGGPWSLEAEVRFPH